MDIKYKGKLGEIDIKNYKGILVLIFCLQI